LSEQDQTILMIAQGSGDQGEEPITALAMGSDQIGQGWHRRQGRGGGSMGTQIRR
jgi:hypothetical protein